MSRLLVFTAIVALLFALLFNVTVDAQIANAAPECRDARCWYVKYKREQRKSARLKRQKDVLKMRNRALLGIVHRRDPLTKSITPWVNLAMCESTWRWHITGNFDGGLQFLRSTWTGYGGRTFAPRAHQATPIQQVAIAQKVLASQGRYAWPACTRKGAW